jgi:hypothetical protein
LAALLGQTASRFVDRGVAVAHGGQSKIAAAVDKSVDRYILCRLRYPNEARECHGDAKRSFSSSSIMRASCLSLALLGVSLVLAGCGAHTDRLPVSGKITLDGAPIDGGAIRFSSTGEKLIASGAAVNGGQYSIPAEKGLPPGTYRIEISAPDTSGKMIAARAPDGKPAGMAPAERVPDEYNSDSKKTVEVVAAGDNHFDFDIVTKSAGKAAK